MPKVKIEARLYRGHYFNKLSLLLQSASTLEMVKKDLNEFVDVIQGDTSVAMNETADKLDKHVEVEFDRNVIVEFFG